jgi:hypothetical protein
MYFSNRSLGRAIAQQLVAGFPPRQPEFTSGQSIWDLLWTKGHWGGFSPSNLLSPTNHHSTNFSINIITRVGTIDLLLVTVPNGPNWTPTSGVRMKKIKKLSKFSDNNNSLAESENLWSVFINDNILHLSYNLLSSVAT